MKYCEVCGEECEVTCGDRLVTITSEIIALGAPIFNFARINEHCIYDKDGKFTGTIYLCKKHGEMHDKIETATREKRLKKEQLKKDKIDKEKDEVKKHVIKTLKRYPK